MQVAICRYCGREWTPRFRNRRTFCSRSCSVAERVAKSRDRASSSELVTKRFSESFIPEPNSGCWLWTGWTGRRGYGAFHLHGRGQMISSRAAWTILRGEIPDGLWVLHRCNTPACVNPDHLYLGDVRDNVRDMIAAGRQSRKPTIFGEAHYRAKLSEQNVFEIRSLYRSGSATQRELAALFGISKTSVSGVINGRSWRHIPR